MKRRLLRGEWGGACVNMCKSKSFIGCTNSFPWEKGVGGGGAGGGEINFQILHASS